MKPLLIKSLLLLLVNNISAGEPAAPHPPPPRIYERPVPKCPDQQVWTPDKVGYSGKCLPCPADTVWQVGPNGRGECVGGTLQPIKCKDMEIYYPGASGQVGYCGPCPPGGTWKRLPNGEGTCDPGSLPPPPTPTPTPPIKCRDFEIYYPGHNGQVGYCGPCPPGGTWRRLPNGEGTCDPGSLPSPPPPTPIRCRDFEIYYPRPNGQAGYCGPCPPGGTWRRLPNGEGTCDPGSSPLPPPTPTPPTPIRCRDFEIYYPGLNGQAGYCGPCPSGTAWRMLPNGQPICSRTPTPPLPSPSPPSPSPPPPSPSPPPSVCIPGKFDFLTGARLKGGVFTLVGGSPFYLDQLPAGHKIVVVGQHGGSYPRGTLVIEVSQDNDCQKVVRVYCC